MIVDPDDIEYVHLELTSRCNASCPFCPRTGNSVLPLTELHLEDFKRIFSPSFLGRLKILGLCGNYGDPIVARDMLPICEHVREHSDCLIRVHTNGSARSTEWWTDLARIIEPNGQVVWGIDGLEDTNHLYRVGTDWNVITRNAKAFNEAGGQSEWQFIPFEHNQHQVTKAKAVAVAFGFSSFLRRDKRPSKPPLPDPSIPPQKVEREPFDVECDSTKRKMLYVSAEGLVFPCCWVGNIYQHDPELQSLIQRHGKDSISALAHSLHEIVSGPMWTEISEWKLQKCDNWCGSRKNRRTQETTRFENA